MDVEVQEYFRWFWINADFGPADLDVRIQLEKRYERETGKKVPKGLSYQDDEVT